MQDHGSRPTIEMAFDNVEMVKQAVAGGAGISILPVDTVLKEVEHGALAAIALDPPLTRPLGILHRRQKHLSVAARAFLDVLRHCQSPEAKRPPL